MISIHMTTARRFRNGLLPAAVESVLCQTFTDFELIVCDDASTDGTTEYLESVAARDPRVRVFRNQRNEHSVAVSLGRCFAAADPTRSFVSWMFDDNRLAPQALERLIEAWVEQPDCAVIFGVTSVPLAGGGELLVGDRPIEIIRRDIDVNACLMPNAGIILHRDLFDRVGWYDASVLLRRSCDWDLFRRIVRSGAAIRGIPDRLVEERGALEPDSLRNSFTTDAQLMKKYGDLRDRAGWRVDLTAALFHPIDRVPDGDWTDDELRLCRRMFVEYYQAVGRASEMRSWMDPGEAAEQWDPAGAAVPRLQ